jgi:hypothetical protein
MRTASLALPVLFLAALGPGCAPQVQSRYEGMLTCNFEGDRSPEFFGDLSLSLGQPDADTARGNGTLSWTDTDDIYWAIHFEAIMRLIDEVDDRSIWSMNLRSCSEIDVGAIECPSFGSVKIDHMTPESSIMRLKGRWFGGGCSSQLF